MYKIKLNRWFLVQILGRLRAASSDVSVLLHKPKVCLRYRSYGSDPYEN